MRIMTYNIFNGAVENSNYRAVIDVVRHEKPDVLILNEANEFDSNNNARLKDFAKNIDLPYFHLEECGDGWGYHVALLSRYPILSVKAIKPVLRGIIEAEIKISDKTYTITALHLSPFTERDRMQEISLLLPHLDKGIRQIVAGDFNSLSIHDKFTPEQISTTSQGFKDKFTQNGNPLYDVYMTLIDAGMVDAADVCGDSTATVPTSIGHTDHPSVRLDRILVSADLKNDIKRYNVIVNDASSVASDHFPVVIDL